jgi:hypothetical protein
MAHKVIEIPGYDPELEAAMQDYDPTNKPYSKEDEDLIRRYYGKADTEIIAKKLGRNKSNIQNKAARMGLTRGRA